MIAKHTRKEDLNKALELINEKYDNNIRWNREPEQLDKYGYKWRFTLRVNSSKGKGAKLSYSYHNNVRRTSSACWHVHGDFFDTLLNLRASAIIETSSAQGLIKIYISEEGNIVGNWKDRNIGSIMFPVYYSESCLCSEWQ